MREPKVTTYNENDYSTLIGDFVNQVKREVEDAWNWTELRTQIDITTTAGDFTYNLTGAGNRYRILKDVHNGGPAVYNTTTDYQLYERSAQWIRRIYGTSNVTNEDPVFYGLEGRDANGDPGIVFYGTPDATQTIQFNCVVPQADLAAGATVLTVPEFPVILGTWALAIAERGEDGGISYSKADDKYRTALMDAIGIDSARVPHEMVWTC